MRTGALAAIFALVSAPLRAEGPVDVQLFRPAVDSKGYFTQNGSQILGHLEPSFGLFLNYGLRPLELHNSDGQDMVVDSLITTHLQVALGLFRFGELGLGVPLTILSGTRDPDVGAGIDAQGVGDLTLFAKARFLSTSRNVVGLGAVVSATTPTGDDTKFLGEGQLVLAPSLVIDKEFARDTIRLALNLGVRMRGSESVFVDEQVDANTPPDCPASAGSACGTGQVVVLPHTQATFGAGFTYSIVPQRFDFIVETFGSSGSAKESDVSLFPLEALGGFKLYLARNSFLAFGGGAGITEAFGSPDARAFVSFVFEPSIGDRDYDSYKDDVDRCPDDPEDFDDFEDRDGCPEPDNDRDGILDPNDTCPNEPEDKDGQQDRDGCWEPDELDRDGDGLRDERDACADEPEDKDSFEDDEGCPDPDNDRDTILDVDDACPLDPEDLDKFEDEEGCPDPDNDKDRIVDVEDKCPNEPEVYNGFEDEDGCPDRGRVLVRKGRIEIFDKIYFETDKAIIKPISFPLLDAIVATLRGNPQILQVEIQGHADERAPDDYNIQLTQARSESVRQYLIDKGIKPERLVAKGYGETKPVCPEHDEECWSKNRRVEFVILKRAEESD